MLSSTNLIAHKFVKPRRKASPGAIEGDASEEIEEVAPRCGPRMKFASNALVPSSKVEIKENMKKLSWWKRCILCMNVDTEKKLHR
jgi:hypothetical protein